MDEIGLNDHWWHPIIKRIIAIDQLVRIYPVLVHRADEYVYRLTGGKHTVVNLLTGLPILLLTTIGAKTGKMRTVPLVGLPEQGNIALIASNWGSSRHPGWYYNLKANPEAIITTRQKSKKFCAQEVFGDEREKYWQQAVSFYPGFQGYEARTGGRIIPIMLLKPKEN